MSQAKREMEIGESEGEIRDLLIRMWRLLSDYPMAQVSDLERLALEEIEEERRAADLDYLLSKDD